MATPFNLCNNNPSTKTKTKSLNPAANPYQKASPIDSSSKSDSPTNISSHKSPPSKNPILSLIWIKINPKISPSSYHIFKKNQSHAKSIDKPTSPKLPPLGSTNIQSTQFKNINSNSFSSPLKPKNLNSTSNIETSSSNPTSKIHVGNPFLIKDISRKLPVEES